MKKVYSILLILVLVSAPAIIFAQDQATPPSTDQSAEDSSRSTDQSSESTAQDQQSQDQPLGAGGDQTQGAGGQEAQGQAGQMTVGSPFISDNLVRLGALIGQQVSGGQVSGTVSDFVLSADGNVEFVQIDVQGAAESGTSGTGEQLGSGGTTDQTGAASGGTSGTETPDQGAGTAQGTTDQSGAAGQAGAADQSGTQTASGLTAGSYLVPVSAFQAEGQNITLNIQDTSSLQPAANYSQVASQDSVRLTQLLQYSLSGGQDMQGKVVDVVADLQSGRIQYVAISSSGTETLGAGEQLQAVPYQNVWYNKTDKTVRIEGAQGESFSADTWPTQLAGGQSADGTLGSGEAQGSGQTAPSTDQPAPSTDQTAPSTDQTAPSTDQPAPSTDQTQGSGDTSSSGESSSTY